MSVAPRADPSPVGLPGPIRVIRVDVDGPLPELSPFRDGGLEYAGAWVIAMRDGYPLGHVDVPLDGRVVTATELRELLSSNLGQAWSARATQEAVADERLPFVSVVVPSTFERVSMLEECVAALAAQEYPAFEVIVVDNRPDGSEQRAEAWRRLTVDARVSVVAEPRPGISPARNRGVAAAAGQVVAFTDDDVEVDPGWLGAIGRRFATEPQTDCVTGLVLPTELETPAQIWFERSGSKIDQSYAPASFGADGARRSRLLGRLRSGRFQVTARRAGVPDETVSIYSGKYGMGANMAFRTAALRELGGFHEALGAGSPSRGGEDLHAITRLLFSGRRLVFDPAVFVFHTHRRTHDELERQLYGYGTGFTAMLAALVTGDVRHVIGLVTYLAGAVRLALHRSAHRQASDYPPELSRAETRGLLRGPWLYFVSRRHARRRARVDDARHAEVATVVG